ncbi:hypothetical protein HY621_03865, partial [Candidatus Uhrbacteria bacterium]|nr:hypothetical protein [Candidatus Uhrbacteria bacterium]
SYIRAGSAPIVNSVTAAAASQGNSATFTLTENTTTTLYTHGTITDIDGCADVATNGTITGKLYRTNHTSGDGCSTDNNDCYSVQNANCTKTACDGPEDNTFSYECTTAIHYYADSTTSGQYASTNWTAKITATDGALLSASASDTIEMNSTIALSLSSSSIQYGSLNLDAQSAQQTLSIANTGNTGIDINLSASGGMACDSGSMPVDAAHYSLTSGFSYAGGISLTGSQTELEFDLTTRTSDASPQTKDIYFILKAPSSGAGGNCSNSLTITSRADAENGW